jgi:hypothetical protein
VDQRFLLVLLLTSLSTILLSDLHDTGLTLALGSMISLAHDIHVLFPF